MDKNNNFELSADEEEFLHKMIDETFDFDKWADDMDEALKNAEIEEILKSIKPAEDFEFDF